MAKGFTPLIVLAVVMALALAAVFGSMSLANPAMAAIGQPADAELTERTISPQDATLKILKGDEDKYLPITHLLEDGRDSFLASAATATSDDAGVVSLATPNFQASSTVVELGLNGVEEGTARITIVVTKQAPYSGEQTLIIEVEVGPEPASTPATQKGRLPNLDADIGLKEDANAVPPIDADEPGDAIKVSAAAYFTDGTGPKGEIENYTVSIAAFTPTNTDNVEIANAEDATTWISTATAAVTDITTTNSVTVNDGVFWVRSTADAAVGNSARIRVTANDTIERTGDNPPAVATQRFYVDVVAIVNAPMAVTGLEVVEVGDGSVTLEWNEPADADRITNFEWRAMPEDGEYSPWKALTGADPEEARRLTITGLTNGVEYTFQVRAVVGTKPGPDAETGMDVVPAVATPMAPRLPVDPSFEADSTTPGSVARYEFNFRLVERTNTLINDLIIELEDFGVPSSIGTASITIDAGEHTFTPEDVAVDGEEVFVSIGDITEDDDEGVYWIEAGTDLQVVFRKSAGISNPTEQNDYGVNITFGENEWNYEDLGEPGYLDIDVVRKVSLDEEDGGLGDVIEVTGKGFKNGTTLTVFLDHKELVVWNDPATTSDALVPLPGGMVEEYNARVAMDEDYGNIPGGTIPTVDGDDGTALHIDDDGYAWSPNGNLDLSDDVLCVEGNIGGNDVGSCEFTVTHPTFAGGLNYINAVDGRDGYAVEPETFLLEASITASPAGGSPGETIVIQVVDFPPNEPIDLVEISRQPVSGWSASADGTGADNFQIIIPNWVKAGAQELRVSTNIGTSDDPDWVRASTNIDLLGPQINVTPGSVLANQRISLVGTGFSPGAIIANDDDPFQVADAEISIGGRTIHESRINDGDPVRVDNGGNWSASVDLPLAEATTAEGERALRVSDSRGRTGGVVVTIPTREVTVTPDQGRVGTIAVVRGTGFPSKNDEGSSFNVEIVYDASNGNTTTVSATPDASGRFETQLRIPTTAAIPSSNSIKVSFRDTDQVVVVTTVAHEVPEGIISLSNTSGGPGSTVTINGEGFKSFVPISLVKVGTLDVTPAPKPSTDGNGMMEFDVLIPGLDVGIQTIEVSVGRTTASTGFTVTESGVNPGDIKPVAEALEELGDNVVSVWNFNNDTKVWSFYDPTLAEGNTLTHMITGETYLLRVKTTAEVILNNDTRSLTCVGANCWNQVVW